MKKPLILFFTAATITIPGYAITQHHAAVSTDSIATKRISFHPCLSWELELGSSFLTNTNVSANRPLADSKTMSGSYFTNMILPLTGKERHPFAAHIGVGVVIQTFGLNKIIENDHHTSAFAGFPSSNIRYSYLQEIFVAAPVGFVYSPFRSRKLELEIDGIAGYLVYKEHQFYTTETDGYSIHSTERIHNLNPFQYGLRGKMNLLHFRESRSFGCIFSISGNYYISELFKPINNTHTKSFSIMVGIGFFIHR